jgi:prepilin-type N-terminal cleavage/methylation domain-containing protein
MALAESRCVSRDARGFTLVEVMVAVVLLMIVALGAAQLFAVATTANFRAKSQTSTTILAIQKMEQLRGLEWGFDTEGLPVSDVSTDLSRPQPTGGGNGLNPSPADSLTRNAPGYFDFLDVHGAWLDPGDPNSLDQMVYTRRWSIQPLPTNPNNTLVFQVRVIPRLEVAGADATGARALEEAGFFSLKTRKSR